VLTGCSRTVAMSDPTPDAAAAGICTTLMAALPAQVLDEDRRHVAPGVFSAAWGDPTITLRCGAPKPPSMNAGSPCFEVNSVGWFAEQAKGGYLFTTIGRAAYVEVGVPDAYSPEANALVDLADAIKASVPVRTPCL
jgi:hypothetical protein